MRRKSSLVLSLLGGCLFAGLALAAPQQIRLGWQSAPSTTMTVTWRSTQPTGSVEYALNGAATQTLPSVSTSYGGGYLHRAEITGLSPGTSYVYRVGTANDWSASNVSFATAPQGPGQSFRFLAFGDSRTDDAARTRLRDVAIPQNAAFSLLTGDQVADGDIQSQWDEWFTTMQPMFSKSPVMPALGNHEGNAPRYFQQFALPRHSPSVSTYDDRAYYSYTYSNTHFVALSSEPVGAVGSAQYKWLEADLAKASTDPSIRWTVVYAHRPPYSSGSHGSDLDVRNTWGPLFDKYGVDVGFFGHDHHYERSKPMKAGKVTDSGVVYYVTGGAGAPLREVGSSDFTASARSDYHFLEATVTDSELRLEARGLDGQVFDSYTLTNTTPLPAGPPPVVTAPPPVGTDPLPGTGLPTDSPNTPNPPVALDPEPTSPGSPTATPGGAPAPQAEPGPGSTPEPANVSCSSSAGLLAAPALLAAAGLLLSRRRRAPAKVRASKL